MPLISVIVPTYNRAHLVTDAIQSILDQTYTDFELIVVDDGSTDDTEAKIKVVADQRLTYVKQENKGVAAARNTGIHLCTGKFVSFLDSDDFALPNRLAAQIEGITTRGADLVYGLCLVQNEITGQLTQSGNCHNELDLKQLLLGPAINWSTVLVRKSLLDQVGRFDEQFRVGEEWELTLRLAMRGCSMACISEPLVVNRTNQEGLSHRLYLHTQFVQKIIAKTFENPNFPSELADMKHLCYAALLSRHAASAYLSKQSVIGQQLLKQALDSVDRSDNFDTVNFVLDRFLDYLTGVSLESPEDVLAGVVTRLPYDGAKKRRIERYLWSKLYVVKAFTAYCSGHRYQCICFGLNAIATRPAWLKDRGIVSILVRSAVLVSGNRRTGPE